jgi:uncharacterized membrane protein YeiH
MTDHRRTRQARLLQFIDVAGTFVLAIQGASIAADKGLDAFGIVVVSPATATGGGVMRDVLIGESPPEALRGWPIVTAALLGALTTFFAFHIVEEIPEHILTVVDALGLSLLAVSGTEKALAFRLTPIAAVMMGAISGAGGYTIRDILLAEVPAILGSTFLQRRRLSARSSWSSLGASRRLPTSQPSWVRQHASASESLRSGNTGICRRLTCTERQGAR